jgi:cell division protein FtsL
VSVSDVELDLYHVQGAIASLRQDVDALRAELSEVKAELAEEVRRRRTLSSRIDSQELAAR